MERQGKAVAPGTTNSAPTEDAPETSGRDGGATGGAMGGATAGAMGGATAGAPEPDVDALLGLVDRLASVLAASELEELEVEAGGTTLRLRRALPEAAPGSTGHQSEGRGGGVGRATNPAGASGTSGMAAGVLEPGRAAAGRPGEGGSGAAEAAGAAGAATAPLPGAEESAPARPSVKAPLTGIWYASPAPGAAPFVRLGGEVAVGQVIGLIEAMKLFNEIKSDLAGRVVRICVEDGQLVKAKQPLIEVEPL